MLRLRDARGSRVLIASLAMFAACATPTQRAERAARAAEIAQAFETAEPYSPRHLDTMALATFLAARPTYRPDSSAIAAFYQRRAQQFAWFIGDSLTTHADAFRSLAGLSDSIEPRPDARCDSCLATKELYLTAEFFRFAARDYGGHFSRDLRELEWFIPRTKRDIGRLLDSLASRTADLSAFEPLHPQYQKLRAALTSLRVLEGTPWPALALPAGRRRIQPGDSAEILTAIRARLTLLGDHVAEPSATSPPTQYDSALVASVQRFQARHGLTTDGIIGTGVLRALNIAPATQVRTLLTNMERLRWLPESQPANALVVNIPDFRLHVYEGAREAMSMPIVVGAEATKTVIFTASLSSVVLSPTWTVPLSIVRNEMLPKMRRDAGYLRRNQMEIIGGTASLPVIRQRPGAHNALGRVKFVFPNGFGIFMHDTPSKGLFAREQRAFSHGCIRLSQPQALAEFLLRDAAAWPSEKIAEGMMSERETSIRLATPRPVWIVYFTAWVDDAGVLQLRDDVYGHDARLAEELFREEMPPSELPARL